MNAISPKVDLLHPIGADPPNGSKSMNQDLNRACACCSKFLFVVINQLMIS